MITKEIYTKLKDQEKVLKNAVNMDFVHLSAEEFKMFAEIYTEVFGVSLTRSQMNCNSCRLKALKDLGKEYFKVAVSFEQLEKEEQEIVNQQVKKRGRPKKIDVE